MEEYTWLGKGNLVRRKETLEATVGSQRLTIFVFINDQPAKA